MTGYEKKVVYFDLLEDGIRTGNAGFAKVIVQNGQLRLTTNINGLHKTDTLKTEIVFEKNDKNIVADTIHIKEGRCVYSRFFTAEELNELDVEWKKVHTVSIKVGNNRKLTAVMNSSAMLHVEEEIKEENQSCLMQLEKQFEQVNEVEECIEEQHEIRETSEDGTDVWNGPTDGKKVRDVWFHDDKWKQLEEIFPHIHPFGDGKEFLSVKPNDFVVLTKEYQCLANNSFLLHGFYNYHYIILGKLEGRVDDSQNTEKIYIGVPGVFYEREKAVALMFGFESFECGKENAEIGTFGYYMKRVEI